jgi:hypothetical protein
MTWILTVTAVIVGLQIAPQQIGTETISGTVTRADTKAPLPNTRIELVREDYKRVPTGHEKVCKPEPDSEISDARRFVTSDANGTFRITNIVPGRYYLLAQREGFLTAAYGQRGRYPLGTVLSIGLPDELSLLPSVSDAPLPLPAISTFSVPVTNIPTPPRGGLGRDQQGTQGGAPSAIRDGTLEETALRGGLGRDAARIGPDTGAPTAISENNGASDSLNLQDLKFFMTPAPTIAGTILHDTGATLAAASVQAYQFRHTPMNGRTLTSMRAALTDDRGYYRLFWLDPGQYVVAAGHSRYGMQPWMDLHITPNLPDADAGQPVTFYASSITAANAQPVRLAAGAESTVDLRLRDRPRFTVRIRLVGNPLPSSPSLVFVPHGGDLCAAMDYGITSTGNGAFVVRDVPSGIYFAMAMNGRNAISEMITVKVERDSAEDILLPITAPVTVRGNVYIEGLPPGAPLRVNLTRSGQEVRHVSTTVTDPETGRFSIPGVGPGSYFPTVDLPAGLYVRDIVAVKFDPQRPQDCSPPPSAPNYSYLDSHGHFDIERPLQIPSVIPNAAECLSIFLARGGALRGRVFDRLRRPVAGALVIGIPKSVWAKTDDRGATPPDRYLAGVTDHKGYFQLFAADQVEYHLYAFENIDPNLIYDPGFSDRFQNREAFTIRKWQFKDGKWDLTGGGFSTIATYLTCGDSEPGVINLCDLTVIPVDVTEEAR